MTSSAQMPLAGTRILDFSSGPAAGLATMVLADFGAEVLKVERPGGDPARAHGSAPLWLRGKRSCEIDLTTPSGQRTAQELAAEADVVVVSQRTATRTQLGIDQDVLGRANAALIYCAVTGWGSQGPYADWPAWEGLVAAKFGRMFAFAGQKQRAGPSYAAVQVATHAASQGAVHGILGALLRRDRTGQGALVETSLLQGLMPYDLLSVPTWQLIQRDPDTFGNLPVIGGGMPTLNYHPIMAGDGRWMQCGNLLEHLFYSFLEASDLIGELLADERFQNDAEGWSKEATEFARDRMLERLQERDVDTWMEIFRAQGHVAIEPYLTAQEALDHVDLKANGDVVEHVHPRLGTVRQIGLIAELTATPGAVGGPAPEVNADSAAWTKPRRSVPVVTPSSARDGRLLEGLTIVESGTIIATPLGASMLADLGARVIKIEPITGDPFREMGVGPTVGLMAAKMNAGKESICLNLKSEEGQRIAQQLIARSNALVHNYRPGVPERIGIGYEQLKAFREDLVWVSANGYGRHSASSHRPSAHPVPGAVMGGAIYQAGTGCPDSNDRSLEALRETCRQLMRANEANPDPNTSVVIASALLLGLLAQQRYGVGQQIFLNMLTANAYANWDDFLSYEGKPERPPVDEQILGLNALYRLYETAAGWVFLAAPTDPEFRRLCAALGHAEWAADERFVSAAARANHDAALTELVATELAASPAAQWEAELSAQGVGCVCADAASVGEFVSTDPHVAANGFAPETRHGHFGDLKRWAPLTRADGGLDQYEHGVLAGADTDALLDELGLGAELTRLRDERIVA